jgi:RNA polymerase sigma factor (sigma-70 family)
MAIVPDAATTASEDSALMVRVQAGDESAFTALMQRWELPVKSVIARIVLNTSEAEDLAQETFVRVWHRRHQFTAGRPVKPWILGIAVNLARNRLRWWRHRPQVALDQWVEVPEGSAPRAGEGSQRLESAERSAAVRDAIASLTPDFRDALVLFEYENMSYEEIAEALGTTLKTVENRITRARQKLRSKLEHWAKV